MSAPEFPATYRITRPDSAGGVTRTPDEAAMARLADLLEALYGRGTPMDAVSEVLRRWAVEHPQPTAPGRRARFGCDDVALISYADQVRPDPGGRQAPVTLLGRALRGPLAGLVNTVHLLPFYPWTSDDGFAVVDYRRPDPAVGTWPQIRAALGGHRLMFDFVANHVSASSAWVTAFRAGDTSGPGRFIKTCDPTIDLRGITRPRTHPVLTPMATAAGVRHVWTTFSADQIDLDWSVPELFTEMLQVALLYVEQGAGVLRLDAVGFLWKEPGTSCVHLPQTHLIVQALRAALDAVAPQVAIITETNVPHADNVSYFGDGCREAQLVYGFALPPLVAHTMVAGDSRALSRWVAQLRLPAQASFLTFLASHDGIGVVPADGLLTPAEIQALVERTVANGGQVSYKENPDGSRSPYELNTTWYDLLNAPGTPDAEGVARHLASHAVLLALAGVPALYVHSLLGSSNDQAGAEASGRARSLNRARWTPRQLAELAGDGRGALVLDGLRRLLGVRRAHPAFAPHAPQRVLDGGPSVFALQRSQVTCLTEVAGGPARVSVPDRLGERPFDLLTGESVKVLDGQVELAGYQTRWLVPDPATPPVPRQREADAS